MAAKKPEVGRKVLVYYEAEITEVHDDGAAIVVRADPVAPGHHFIVYPGQFEVRDQPELDPVGTVRTRKEGTFIKMYSADGDTRWYSLLSGVHPRTNGGMAGDSNIIGRINPDYGRLEPSE